MHEVNRMLRPAHIAALLVIALVGVFAHAAIAVANDDAGSLLVINGRVVDGDRDGVDTPPAGSTAPKATPAKAAPARPAAQRPVPLARQPRSIFRATRMLMAIAVKAGTDQQRIVRVAWTSTPAAPSRPWYRAGVQRSITYVSRPSGDLQLDVWYPRGRTTPAPTILLVHGGGWRAGGREEWDRVGWTRQLVHRGYVVVTPSYRMSCEPGGLSGFARLHTDQRLCGFSLAESVVDVRRALGWARRNIGDHGGDRDRLVLVGASAGGHLALMAGADRGAFVRGVAAISPATDLSWFGKRPKAVLYGAARQAVGCPIRKCPDQWRGYSPSTLAANARLWPPTYVFDAAADRVTPSAQNEPFLRALDSRGAEVTLRHPVRIGSQCHGTYSCSQWPVDGTRRSLLDDVDAWVLSRVS